MNYQDKQKQKKEQSREEQKRADKAHEETMQQNRLPLNPVWMMLGIVLTLLVIYFWTFDIW